MIHEIVPALSRYVHCRVDDESGEVVLKFNQEELLKARRLPTRNSYNGQKLDEVSAMLHEIIEDVEKLVTRRTK
jgi:hypothetical protein